MVADELEGCLWHRAEGLSEFGGRVRLDTGLVRRSGSLHAIQMREARPEREVDVGHELLEQSHLGLVLGDEGSLVL